MNTQTRTTGGDVDLLGLGSVLVGSLPSTLLTDAAPDHYTVEAVFTRRPDPDEINEILGGDTRDFLARAGHPTVELTVSDRRLEIANTNLEELRDGLSGFIAQRLADISAGVRARREASAARFQHAAEHEQERAAAVAALAESVTFRVAPDGAEASDRQTTPADREQLSEWAGEGGRGH